MRLKKAAALAALLMVSTLLSVIVAEGLARLISPFPIKHEKLWMLSSPTFQTDFGSAVRYVPNQTIRSVMLRDDGIVYDVRFTTNDLGFTVQCAIAGLGLALLPRHAVCDYLPTGELVRVLPKHKSRPASLHLIRPATDHVPRKVSAFTEYAVEYFKTNAGRARS